MQDLEHESEGVGSRRVYKIVLVGESQTGKTSLINCITGNKFNDLENVDSLIIGSRQSGWTSSPKTWSTNLRPIVFSFGILLAIKDIFP